MTAIQEIPFENIVPSEVIVLNDLPNPIIDSDGNMYNGEGQIVEIDNQNLICFLSSILSVCQGGHVYRGTRMVFDADQQVYIHPRTQLKSSTVMRSQPFMRTHVEPQLH